MPVVPPLMFRCGAPAMTGGLIGGALMGFSLGLGAPLVEYPLICGMEGEAGVRT
jgi:hypothetical protein